MNHPAWYHAYRFWLAAGLLLVALGACQPAATPTPFPTSRTTTPVSVAAVETAAPTPSATQGPPTALPDTATPGPTPTPSRTPTATPTPSITPTPTQTPTPAPQFAHVLPTYTTAEGAPTPVPLLTLPPRTTNILLLGKDSAEWGEGGNNTDSIILVSINRELETASMLSFPRDLYVYVPGAGEMRRLNTAAYGSVQSLKDSILYNFGLQVHYYARVDFEGFVDVIDTLGGVDLPVTCPLEDWRLKAPGLDINDEDNWEWFQLDAGVHHFDGDMALWYARSRKTTSDFDRGRRQQQLLRAILNAGVDLNLVADAPRLWDIYQDRVETDLDIGRILQLATLAPTIRQNGIQSLYLNQDVTPYQLADGSVVQLPDWDRLSITLQRLYLPPTLSSASRSALTVEIINASGNPDLAFLTAENLAWYGFVPFISAAAAPPTTETQLTFNAPNLRGSFAWLIAWIMDLPRPETGLPEGEYGIGLNPDATSAYDYQLVLGADYDPCRPYLYAPQAFIPLPTSTPTSTPEP